MTILNYRDSLFDFRIQYTNNTLAASQTGIRDTTYKQNNLTKLIEIIQLINEVWHFFHKTCSPALFLVCCVHPKTDQVYSNIQKILQLNLGASIYMKELFQDIHIDSIMTFLRQINLFNKI